MLERKESQNCKIESVHLYIFHQQTTDLHILAEAKTASTKQEQKVLIMKMYGLAAARIPTFRNLKIKLIPDLKVSQLGEKSRISRDNTGTKKNMQTSHKRPGVTADDVLAVMQEY